jgi:hypothetical protein
LPVIRLFAALAIALATFAPARANSTETEAAVVKLGGTAKTDQTLDETARVAVVFTTATDAVLLKLGKLLDVGAIRISDATKCSVQGLAALRELPNLQRLQLGKCPLTDAKATALGNLRTLDTLHVGDSKLTDTGLAAMKKLVNLKSLDLLDAPITDKAVTTLVGFTKLEELSLAGTKITDKGVPLLAPLENLKTLKLQNTAATRKGIDAIEKALPKLTVRY